jgi:hypothetical protein
MSKRVDRRLDILTSTKLIEKIGKKLTDEES